MSVIWKEVNEKLVSVQEDTIDVAKILDVPWDTNSYEVSVQSQNGVQLPVDVAKIAFPALGNFFPVLFAEGDFDNIKHALATYWRYRNKPSVVMRYAVTESGQSVPLGSKLVKDEQRGKRVDMAVLLNGVNESFAYDRVVIGQNNHHTELQFLNSTHRVACKPGDLLDPGLFVSVNGNVQVAAGVNRLVCTNGLIQQMHVYNAKEPRFNREFLDRAVLLANWLVEKQSAKIDSVRELSVVTNKYPSAMLAKFWKDWAAKIETSELTWFDVIDDITRYANKFIDSARYNILAVHERIKKFEDEHACPVCSSSLVTDVAEDAQ